MKLLYIVFISYFDPAYFPAYCLGQLVYKLDDTGVFVWRGNSLHMVLNLLDERFAGSVFIIRGQYDSGFDQLSPYFVGHTGDGALYDGRVGH